MTINILEKILEHLYIKQSKLDKLIILLETLLEYYDDIDTTRLENIYYYDNIDCGPIYTEANRLYDCVVAARD